MGARGITIRPARLDNRLRAASLRSRAHCQPPLRCRAGAAAAEPCNLWRAPQNLARTGGPAASGGGARAEPPLPCMFEPCRAAPTSSAVAANHCAVGNVICPQPTRNNKASATRQGTGSSPPGSIPSSSIISITSLLCSAPPLVLKIRAMHSSFTGIVKQVRTPVELIGRRQWCRKTKVRN